jgi:hypothetical protein
MHIASPFVDTLGPRAVYGEIQGKLIKLQGLGKPSSLQLWLGEISVISPRDGLVKALRRALHAREGSGVRLSSTTFDGVSIGDAYVYRAH